MKKNNIFVRKTPCSKRKTILSVALLVILAGGADAATPIDLCTIISSPGVYKLNQSIIDSTASSCISINSNDVVFDGAGYTIDGKDIFFTYGLYVTSQSNITVKNLKVTDWDNGIGFFGVSNGSLIDNIASSNGNGISLTDSSNNTLTKNNATTNNNDGFWFFNSENNTLTDNIAISNSNNGISFSGGSHNKLIKNVLSSNSYGIFLVTSSNNILTDNHINSSNKGISIGASDNNILTENTINSSSYGIYLFSGCKDNKIYNNYFHNTNNAYDDGNNIWNISKTVGTNIVGGPYLGGNFWGNPSGTGFSQTCSDSDNDGICDSPYLLDVSNIDYLPLAYYISDITSPASITELTNITYGHTYINFTWLNPPDPDFSHVKLYLNGTFLKNITAPQNFANITGLSPDTLYELGTHTVDTSGNINQTWVNATARTAPADSNPPVADCGADKLKCENVASPVQFNASASYDPDGTIISYAWEFGDGTNDTGAALRHTYYSYKWNGTAYLPFTANLTVMDNNGLTNRTSQKVIVWIAGDSNGDGKVNILDASLVGLRWNSNPAEPCADLNNDAKVNILDASIIGLNWGKRA